MKKSGFYCKIKPKPNYRYKKIGVDLINSKMFLTFFIDSEVFFVLINKVYILKKHREGLLEWLETTERFDCSLYYR